MPIVWTGEDSPRCSTMGQSVLAEICHDGPDGGFEKWMLGVEVTGRRGEVYNLKI